MPHKKLLFDHVIKKHWEGPAGSRIAKAIKPEYLDLFKKMVDDFMVDNHIAVQVTTFERLIKENFAYESFVKRFEASEEYYRLKDEGKEDQIEEIKRAEFQKHQDLFSIFPFLKEEVNFGGYSGKVELTPWLEQFFNEYGFLYRNTDLHIKESEEESKKRYFQEIHEQYVREFPNDLVSNHEAFSFQKGARELKEYVIKQIRSKRIIVERLVPYTLKKIIS